MGALYCYLLKHWIFILFWCLIFYCGVLYRNALRLFHRITLMQHQTVVTMHFFLVTWNTFMEVYIGWLYLSLKLRFYNYRYTSLFGLKSDLMRIIKWHWSLVSNFVNSSSKSDFKLHLKLNFRPQRWTA